MNNIDLKKEVTILKTWKGEEFEIEISYEDFLVFENTLKNNGEDGFDSKKYRRFIKFSSIEDKIGKTKILSLPSPRFEKYIYTEEDKRKSREFYNRILEETKDSRKKKFLKRRDEIIKKLENEEKYFGLETTKSKLEEYFKLKAKNITKAIR